MTPTVPNTPPVEPEHAATVPPAAPSTAPGSAPPTYVPVPPGYAPTPRRTSGSSVAGIVIGVTIAIVLLCAGSVAAIGAVAGWWFTHQTTATRTSTLSVAVPDRPQVVVHDTAGNVTIVAGSARQVTVEVTKRATDTSSQLAQRALDGMAVTTNATADGVVIEATTGASNPLARRTIDLRITVPATSDLQFDLTAGNAQLSGVTGQLVATMSAGNLELRDMVLDHASRVSLNAGNADLRVALQPDATLDLQVHAGNARLALPQDSATLLNARTSVGNITITGWPATINRSGAGASSEVYFKLNPLNHVNVAVDTGNIVVSAY